MEIIESLIETRDQTLPYFDLAETELVKNYGEGKWNVRQLLNHIVDAETVLYERIRRTIANPGQTLQGFEQDLWAAKLEYNKFPLKMNRDIYVSVRQAIIYLAAEYYDEYGDHEAYHSRTGAKNLKHFFDKVARHNQGHVENIKQALK